MNDQAAEYRQLARLIRRCQMLQEEMNSLREFAPQGWHRHYQSLIVELIETKRLLADWVLEMADALPLPQGVEE